MPVILSIGIIIFLLAIIAPTSSSSSNARDEFCATTSDASEIVLIKVGGSSITDKAIKECLNETAVNWFVETLQQQTSSSNSISSRFVIVHGAGSFGHFTAKEYGLQGHYQPPPLLANSSSLPQSHEMQGVAHTRLSVQTLNRILVSALLNHSIPAIGISPCFGIPSLQAHGGDAATVASLQQLVYDTVQAGLVPVLHGDACLYGPDRGGILSGDTLMEMIGMAPWVHRAIFLTDVDGVFTSDPKTDPTAQLIPKLAVHADGSLQITNVQVSGSSYENDVTGGLKTKLRSATVIAASGTNVTIVRCGSASAKQVIQRSSNEHVNGSTVLFRL